MKQIVPFMWDFSGSLWRGRSSGNQQGDLGSSFYPVITSHWCHYRRLQRKCTSLFSISVYLLSLPPQLPSSLRLWVLSIHLYLPPPCPRSPSLVRSILVTTSSSLAASMASHSSAHSSLTGLSTAPQKECWWTCFWNGFSLWKIPLAQRQLGVTKRSKILRC